MLRIISRLHYQYLEIFARAVCQGVCGGGGFGGFTGPLFKVHPLMTRPYSRVECNFTREYSSPLDITGLTNDTLKRYCHNFRFHETSLATTPRYHHRPTSQQVRRKVTRRQLKPSIFGNLVHPLNNLIEDKNSQCFVFVYTIAVAFSISRFFLKKKIL